MLGDDNPTWTEPPVVVALVRVVDYEECVTDRVHLLDDQRVRRCSDR